MTISIRPVLESDAEMIAALINPIILKRTLSTMQDLLSVADELNFIRSLNHRSICFVAVDERTNKIVGIQDVLLVADSLAGEKDVGEISTFVDLQVARNGIGRQLSEATFVAAKLIGYTKFRATIRSDNCVAIAFYRTLGFGVDGGRRCSRVMGDQSISLILAEKELTLSSNASVFEIGLVVRESEYLFPTD